jgi:multicomponent Na+:H+ antiporter subunit B
MTKIVRSAADLMYPLCTIYGFYVVAHGHLTPGGGFQGGAVIATATALLIVAHQYEEITGRITKDEMRWIEMTGLMGFILVALSALLFGKPLLQNWLANQPDGLFGMSVAYGSNAGTLNSGGLLPVLNIAVGLEVLGGLSLILLYMLSGVKEKEIP